MIIDKEKAAERASSLIKCRTVSHRDESLIDRSEFTKFIHLLKELYPNLHTSASPLFIGKTGIVFRIPSSHSLQADEPVNIPAHQKTCSVLMAHYDVVPTEDDKWEKPPFSGLIEDGFLWGRGTLDTKSTLWAVMEAAEIKLAQGWRPQKDLYLSFSGEEEIDGSTCPDIVCWFQDHSIEPDFVLDEGGAVIENAFPGVKGRTAMVGIAEKGSVNITCTFESTGGHSSTPPVHTAAGLAGRAAAAVESALFKPQLTEPVKKMFTSLAPLSSRFQSFFMKQPVLYGPLIKAASRFTGGELRAMVRTTCAVTKLQGSPAFNVLPPTASFSVNLRLLGTDTIESVTAHLSKTIKKAVRKAPFRLELATGTNPSRISKTDCPQWDMLSSVIKKNWPEASICPYLMMACSDSRHYGLISDKVYRFSGMFLSKQDRSLIHGHNEKIKIDTLFKTLDFYIDLLSYL